MYAAINVGVPQKLYAMPHTCDQGGMGLCASRRLFVSHARTIALALPRAPWQKAALTCGFEHTSRNPFPLLPVPRHFASLLLPTTTITRYRPLPHFSFYLSLSFTNYHHTRPPPHAHTHKHAHMHSHTHITLSTPTRTPTSLPAPTHSPLAAPFPPSNPTPIPTHPTPHDPTRPQLFSPKNSAPHCTKPQLHPNPSHALQPRPSPALRIPTLLNAAQHPAMRPFAHRVPFVGVRLRAVRESFVAYSHAIQFLILGSVR